jgi:hypothetical protein
VGLKLNPTGKREMRLPSGRKRKVRDYILLWNAFPVGTIRAVLTREGEIGHELQLDRYGMFGTYYALETAVAIANAAASK